MPETLPVTRRRSLQWWILVLLHSMLLLAGWVEAADNSDNNNDNTDTTGNGCPRSYSLTIPEAAVKTHSNGNRLIIAHRGASFHLPEHTLAAYRLALEMGADFVEPDLVATQDGHLIALHTADLNVTTDVDAVFGMGGNTNNNREPWFSPYANRTGYWTFNFTLAEIQTLRVRQRLPRARTTAYDGMFSIPTFLEIQQLVRHWNTERIPQLLLHVEGDDGDQYITSSGTNSSTTTAAPTLPHMHYRQTAGVYAELKASPWFQDDANINLVDLLLDEIDSHPHIFQSVLDCPGSFKFDEYKVPPLVVQSFEGIILQELTQKWKAHNSTRIQQAPLPPMILLINQRNCWEESFWFEVGETWRKFVQGVGMDKACFPKVGDHVEEGQSAKERAEEFKLAIHPYAERPEHEFLMEGFQDGLEETQYLFCTIGAQGVFSESVHTAIMAARMGCPTEEEEGNGDGTAATGEGAGGDGSAAVANSDDDEKESTDYSSSSSSDSGGSVSIKPSLCWEDAAEANLYVGLASFVMGAFLTAMLSMWVNRGFSCSQRPPRQLQIPSEEDDDGGIEEPPDDELL